MPTGATGGVGFWGAGETGEDSGVVLFSLGPRATLLELTGVKTTGVDTGTTGGLTDTIGPPPTLTSTPRLGRFCPTALISLSMVRTVALISLLKTGVGVIGAVATGRVGKAGTTGLGERLIGGCGALAVGNPTGLLDSGVGATGGNVAVGEFSDGQVGVVAG